MLAVVNTDHFPDVVKTRMSSLVNTHMHIQCTHTDTYTPCTLTPKYLDVIVRQVVWQMCP